MKDFKDEKQLQDFLVDTYGKYKMDKTTPDKVQAMKIVIDVYVESNGKVRSICDTVRHMDSMTEPQAYCISKFYFENKK